MKRGSLFVCLLVGFAFLMSSGCALVSQQLMGDPGTKEKISLEWIKKGSTTKQQLIDKFGPPSSCVTKSSGEETLTFEEKEIAWELGPLAFVGGKSTRKMLMVDIKGDVVYDYTLVDIGKL